jgi:hypothetical protein
MDTCEAELEDDQDYHDEERLVCDGHVFCWHHYMMYMTDGVFVAGLPYRIHVSNEGLPWWNQ